MTRDEVQQIALQIVAYAGSAFDYFNKAIELAEDNRLGEAEESLKRGEAELHEAHNAQTDLLAAEAGQKEIPFSIIMVHAQDHLTMAIFAERMTKHFITLWRKEYVK
ncbi:Lactose-specific phosphotransferase enzyme IIA component [Clostridium sp. C105KSO15]|nr:Lactose-specific phosphotransferase enzyme IIA component [Clostridium sp. C105KSO15]